MRLLATFEFDRPELLAAFPFRHRIEMDIELAGGMLQVTTTLSATGDEPVPIAFGFHPYLQIFRFAAGAMGGLVSSAPPPASRPAPDGRD